MTKRKSKERSSISKSDTDAAEVVETQEAEAAQDEIAVEDSPAQESAAKTVGMLPYEWCGIPMFRCPDCFETTQNAGKAHSHVCKEASRFNPKEMTNE